jgi:type I restriction enzyme, S subunit
LEGLEGSEVSSTAALLGTPTARIDSEYFAKQHLQDLEIVKGRKADFRSLAELGLTVDASAFYPSIEAHYGDGELPFLRVADVNSYIDWDGCTTIPATLCDQYPTLARVKQGDILLTKGGSIARVGLVTREAAVSRDLIFIDSSKISANEQSFLYLYFQSGFFNRALIRSSSQTAQPHLTITLVRELPILASSEELRRRVHDVVAQAFLSRAAAIEQLAKAESLLLHALGIDAWMPPEALSYVRTSSQAFAAGRLDAQFFAPRVEQLLARLGRDGLRLSDVAPARHERFEPTGSGDFEYIEIGSLGADGTAASECVPMAEAPSRATQHVRAGDVITSTVRPIRRLSALIAPEQDGAVCSSGFVVLQPQGISGEVLLTYLRLPLVCELMDLHTSATMYPAISESDLLALPIPAIAPSVQAQVRDAVRQSAYARQRATRLLDAAKRAVEIAIEDGEPAALRHLRDVL